MANREALVRIRCGRGSCREVLAEFTTEPTDWSRSVQIGSCPKHDTPRSLQRAVKKLGRRPIITLRYVKVSDLRHAFYLADTLGKTTEETVH